MKTNSSINGAGESAAKTSVNKSVSAPLRFAYARWRSGIDDSTLKQKLSEVDGWALSCDSTDLREVLPNFPPGTQVAIHALKYCEFETPSYWFPTVFKPCNRAP